MHPSSSSRLLLAAFRDLAVFEQVEERRLLSTNGGADDLTGSNGHGSDCMCTSCCGFFPPVNVPFTLGGSGLAVGDTVSDGFGGDGDNWDRFSDWTPDDPTYIDHDHGFGTDEEGNSLHARPTTAQFEQFGEFTDGGETFEEPLYDVSETFQLHSLPGADHTIYLDFDGHVTTGTSWNFDPDFPSVITTPAWSLDSDRNSFNNAELINIQQVWARVAEDFAPFRVNVTTEEPPISDLRKQGFFDDRWGVRVAIGPDTWYGPAGGVAFVGSFDDAADEPVFTFTNGTGDGDKGIAEATSHEVGHALGLFHDGQNPGDGEYYSGHNGGETGWAPIMGLGYFTNVTQWSAGEYDDANNLQNDLSIIASSTNGFGYKADDFSGAVSSAATLLPQDENADASVRGTITTSSDADSFRISHGGGLLEIEASTVAIGPNLDILAELYRDNGDGTFTLVDTDNPDLALGAEISGLFEAGDYLLRIDGVGRGDPLNPNPTGYSDYGSIGQYNITVDATGFDDTSPEISDIYLANSNWSSQFLNNLGSEGLGVQMVEDGVTTRAGLGFNNIDTVTIRFSERVQLNADDLLASGLPGGLDPNGFTYDTDTNLATWLLDEPLSRSQLSVSLDPNLSDFAGNTVAAQSFSFNILAGDANGDGAVNLADFGILRGSFNLTPVDANYSIFADFDGSGFVDLADFGALRGNFGIDLDDEA